MSNTPTCLEDWKPKIKPHQIEQTRNGITLRGIDSTIAALPIAASAAPILNLLLGELSLSEIFLQLQSRFGRVSIRQVIATLKKLSDEGYLENPFSFKDAEKAHATPFERNRALPWLTWDLPLTEPMHLCNRYSYLMMFLALLIILGTGWLAFSQTWEFNNAFLRFGSGYGRGLVFLLVVLSGLPTTKAVAQALLSILGTGGIGRLHLRITPLSVSLSYPDPNLFAFGRALFSWAYVCASAAMNLFFALLLATIMNNADKTMSLLTLAIILTFFDLSPYRKSELTRAFSLVSSTDRFEDFLPFLKRRCLLMWLEPRTKLKDEYFLIAFSTAAVGWAFLLLSFLADILGNNIPNMLATVQTEPFGVGNFYALITLSFLVSIFAYSCFDLLHTLALNIAYPFSNHLLRLRRSVEERRKTEKPSDEILPILQNHTLFEHVPADALRLMIERCELKTFRKKSHIIIQGTEGRYMYLLLEGVVKVSKRENSGSRKAVAVLHPGAVFGERAVLEECKRTADVETVTNVRVLAISRSVLTELEKHPDFANAHISILNCIRVGQQLLASPLFQELPQEAQHIITARGESLEVGAGTILVRQGQFDRTFYLLTKGHADVFRNEEKIGEIGEGGFFGEIALLANVPRTATVVATESCELVGISASTFWEVLTSNLNLAMFLESVAEERSGELLASRAPRAPGEFA